MTYRKSFDYSEFLFGTMMLTDEGDGFTLAPDLVEALGIEDFTKKRDYGRERGKFFMSISIYILYIG